MKLICLLFVIIWSVRGEQTLGDLVFKPSDSVVFQNKCMEDLGCFYTGPPFCDPFYRPVCLPPSDSLMIRFYLFTQTNPQEAEVIETTEKSIKDSKFNPQFSLKVLIHGFSLNLTKNDIRYQTKDEFLKSSNYNVIVVDWTKNNKPPYPQAVANTRAVGAKLANLLKVIMNVTGLSSQNIHLIGHSLGAHIAGYTGERIPNIGRITGLDPAGPYFQIDDARVRLDVTDADFVDIIHTNGNGFGLYDPIGHQDFYPNGGKTQPGCVPFSLNAGTTENVINNPPRVVLCSHLRVNDLFKESIDNCRCPFLAVNCTSYIAFRFGMCTPQNSIVAKIGFHAKKIEGLPIKSKFYLRTNNQKSLRFKNSI